MKITVSERRTSSNAIYWALHINGEPSGYAVAKILVPDGPPMENFITPRGVKVYLNLGVHPVKFTDTVSYDYAVPINEDKTYPFDGDAITVYKSNDLDTGIVSNRKVREVAGINIDKAIRDHYGLGS